jgi:hypothetical protein
MRFLLEEFARFIIFVKNTEESSKWAKRGSI